MGRRFNRFLDDKVFTGSKEEKVRKALKALTIISWSFLVFSASMFVLGFLRIIDLEPLIAGIGVAMGLVFVFGVRIERTYFNFLIERGLLIEPSDQQESIIRNNDSHSNSPNGEEFVKVMSLGFVIFALLLCFLLYTCTGGGQIGVH